MGIVTEFGGVVWENWNYSKLLFDTQYNLPALKITRSIVFS